MLDSNDIQIISKLLEQSRNEMHAELEQSRNEMRAELEKNRIETHAEMTALLEKNRIETRDEMKKYREEMRAEMTELLRQNREETRNDMMAIIESEVNPKLQILAEGHEVLLEKINRLEKQDELTGRVVVLEEAVKKHNKELNALKQAQ